MLCDYDKCLYKKQCLSSQKYNPLTFIYFDGRLDFQQSLGNPRWMAAWKKLIKWRMKNLLRQA